MKSDYENLLHRTEVHTLYHEKVVKGVFLSYTFFFKKKKCPKISELFCVCSGGNTSWLPDNNNNANNKITFNLVLYDRVMF